MNTKLSRHKRVRVGLAGAFGIAGVVSISAFGLAMPASAAPIAPASGVIPLSSQGCGGNTCIKLSNPSGGNVTIEGWAHSTGFYGYFHLSGPDGLSENSGSASWTAGGAGAYFTVPATVGQYCMTGHSGSINEGTACESVE